MWGLPKLALNAHTVVAAPAILAPANTNAKITAGEQLFMFRISCRHVQIGADIPLPEVSVRARWTPARPGYSSSSRWKSTLLLARSVFSQLQPVAARFGLAVRRKNPGTGGQCPEKGNASRRRQGRMLSNRPTRV